MVANPKNQDIINIASLEERIAKLESRIQELEEDMPDDKVTLVIFSGDLDKVLAGFIIATGALAMGQEVSMFFTFWGLNALREQRVVKGKTITQQMMAVMSPSDTQNLSVSKMNYFGIGAKMLRHMMKENNVERFEELIQLAQDMGARMVSCGMSQDVMGIKSEELRDGVEDGGVAAYLADALKSRVTLFI